MRQYLKKHIEIIVIAVVLITAMLFQYLRIADIDIAFLYETSVNTSLIYLVVILLIPVVALGFVFIPLLLVFEISFRIELPQTYSIKTSKVIYSIKQIKSNVFIRPRLNTVLRC